MMTMISALLMSAVLGQTPEPPLVRVITQNEVALTAGCNVSNVGYYGALPSLRLFLKNIPGGIERRREYVRCRVRNVYYTLPVINGCLPEVTVTGVDNLVLNYGSAIVYDNKLYGGQGYIVYQDAVVTTTGPVAVKSPESGTQVQANVQSVPTGLKHPDNLTAPVQQLEIKQPKTISEIDSLLLGSPPTQTLESPKGANRPSDAQIEDLLKRPSSVPETSRGLPRY